MWHNLRRKSISISISRLEGLSTDNTGSQSIVVITHETEGQNEMDNTIDQVLFSEIKRSTKLHCNVFFPHWHAFYSIETDRVGFYWLEGSGVLKIISPPCAEIGPCTLGLEYTFSNSLIIHQAKTKEITIVKEVCIPGLGDFTSPYTP